MLGGPEITGVLLDLFVSLLLHAASSIRMQRVKAKFFLWFSFAPLRLWVRNLFFATLLRRISALFVEVILDRGSFILFVWERFTGDSILTFNPPAEIDKLAPLRAEGTKRIVFPLGRLTTGWAFHEYRATQRPAS